MKATSPLPSARHLWDSKQGHLNVKSSILDLVIQYIILKINWRQSIRKVNESFGMHRYNLGFASSKCNNTQTPPEGSSIAVVLLFWAGFALELVSHRFATSCTPSTEWRGWFRSRGTARGEELSWGDTVEHSECLLHFQMRWPAKKKSCKKNNK